MKTKVRELHRGTAKLMSVVYMCACVCVCDDGWKWKGSGNSLFCFVFYLRTTGSQQVVEEKTTRLVHEVRQRCLKKIEN